MSDAGKNITDAMWATTTWEGHRRQQLQEWARLPFDKKIESLEEMQRVAMMFAEQRRKLGLKSVYPNGRVVG